MEGLLRRSRRVLVVLAALVAAGLATRPLEGPAWAEVRAGRPEFAPGAADGAVGRGLAAGMIGGLRTVLADFLWIRLNTLWEKRDLAGLEAMIGLVLTLDPRSEYFRVNAARMLAYDVPHWRVEAEGGYDAVPAARRRRIDLEQAERAFRILVEGTAYHPRSAVFPREIAQIHMNRLGDDAAAAIWFGRAWAMGGPYFTARLHAELLRRQGLAEEAYVFLKDLHAGLPDDDPLAAKDVVLSRIRDLEAELGVGPESAYAAER